MTSIATEQRIYGRAGNLVRRICSLQDAQLRGSEYYFMPADEYDDLIKRDVRAAMRIYWLEIIYRAHYGAITSLLRAIGWLRATIAAAEAENFYGFASSFRGLLESSADSHDALGKTVINLADAHVFIRRAISGQMNQIAVHQELEDTLIHFTHARRVERGESAPPSHKAKPTTEYLKVLEAESRQPILDCYHKLCEITHPAAASTFIYSENDGHGRYRISSVKDGQLIDVFCESFSDLMPGILILGVAPAVYQSRVLKSFAVPRLVCPDFSELELNGPVWDEIQARLNDNSEPKTLPADGGV